MTLTASDVASLKSALGWWEVAEYVSTGIVFIGCVGEFFAEFTPFPRSEWCKHKLARVSLILVIAGIAGELLATVKASELSDQIIAYVEANASDAKTSAEGAAQAASKAQVAATSATGEAEGAAAASSMAKQEASGAKLLARSAREEADSFEKDIVSAKQQAASAQSHLADALHRAANAEKQAAQAESDLAKYRAGRTLTPEQQKRIVEKLKAFPGTPYELAVDPGPEATGLLSTIDAVLRASGWDPKESARTDFRFILTLPSGSKVEQVVASGVEILISSAIVDKHGAAASALVNALRSEGIETKGIIDLKEVKSPKNVHVTVGSQE